MLIFRAISIQPKILEILGEEANRTDLFRNFVAKILVTYIPHEVGLKFRKIRITGKFLSIFTIPATGLYLRTPISLQSILWPIIDPILVTFGQM